MVIPIDGLQHQGISNINRLNTSCTRDGERNEQERRLDASRGGGRLMVDKAAGKEHNF
jgi:hypothetical protein